MAFTGVYLSRHSGIVKLLRAEHCRSCAGAVSEGPVFGTGCAAGAFSRRLSPHGVRRIRFKESSRHTACGLLKRRRLLGKERRLLGSVFVPLAASLIAPKAQTFPRGTGGSGRHCVWGNVAAPRRDRVGDPGNGRGVAPRLGECDRARPQRGQTRQPRPEAWGIGFPGRGPRPNGP